MSSPELIINAHARLGEGPCWDGRAGVLWWVNILADEVHRFDPHTGQDRVFSTGENVCLAIPRARGGILLGLERSLAVLDESSGAIEPLAAAPEPCGNRFNDGKCDPIGRLLIGSLARDGAAGAGTFYRMGADLSFAPLISKVTCSNGTAWSPDGHTLYYIDTPTCEVVAYDYDAAMGAITNRRVVVRVPRTMGWPDGMTIDAEGMLWIALWGGGGVGRWNPATGKQIGRIDLPVSRPSSCAFGGEDLGDLYITSAWEGLDAPARKKELQAGGLFRVRPGVRGLAGVEFAG